MEGEDVIDKLQKMDILDYRYRGPYEVEDMRKYGKQIY